jgi:hypothetical protein
MALRHNKASGVNQSKRTRVVVLKTPKISVAGRMRLVTRLNKEVGRRGAIFRSCVLVNQVDAGRYAQVGQFPLPVTRRAGL